MLALAGLGFVLFGGGDDAENAAPATVPATAAPATVAPATTTPAPTTAGAVVTSGEVFLLALDDPGDAPFTDSVAAEPSDMLLAFASAGPADIGADSDTNDDGDTVITATAGTDDGLFAGERGVEACRPDDLVMQLTDDSDTGAAWADVHDITPDDIAPFVDGLTAINLSSDARVTDHDIADGVATARQTVLQIGTAVLIDEFGLPRVRCASGSPLLLPEAVEGTTSYVGGSWDTFAPEDITVVVAAPEPVTEFVLADVGGGEPIVRPVGSTGASDLSPLPGEILAQGQILSLSGYTGPFDTNEITIVFPPTGGPAEGTFSYSVSQAGVTLSATGEMVGNYDATTFTLSGSATGTITGGGFSQTDTGEWTVAVDPTAGTGDGTLGSGGDVATFSLTFGPFEPPEL